MREKNLIASSPWPGFPNSGIYFACPEHSQGVSFLGGPGGVHALPTVIVQIYLKGQRTDLVLGIFSALRSRPNSKVMGSRGINSLFLPGKERQIFGQGSGCEAKLRITSEETASCCLIFPH